ncbi:hypothetical protein [Coleofasciculus sp. G2-EDA-02]|uniref:hypothetical protein n=1 Tax=Coleofasciculus sp. G2-EDA-02 TaxID=3069529 RepID=UPI003302D4E8
MRYRFAIDAKVNTPAAKFTANGKAHSLKRDSQSFLAVFLLVNFPFSASSVFLLIDK